MEAYIVITKLDEKEEKYKAYGAKWPIPLPKFRWISSKDYPFRSGSSRTFWDCLSERDLNSKDPFARVEMRDWEEFIKPGQEDQKRYLAKEVKILEFYPSKYPGRKKKNNRKRKDLPFS